jgi:hypothetical protein
MNALSTVWKLSFSITLVLSVIAGLAPAAPAQEIEPEKLEVPLVPGTFTVLMTDAEGVESEVFNHRRLPVFDLHFTLAMSTSKRYPVTVTLIQAEEERQLYKGTLEEGYYRLLYPLSDLPVSSGEVTARIILKTRVYTGQKFTGESSYNYQRWEGTYRVGKR